jgi:hypothetical protein
MYVLHLGFEQMQKCFYGETSNASHYGNAFYFKPQKIPAEQGRS